MAKAKKVFVSKDGNYYDSVADMRAAAKDKVYKTLAADVRNNIGIVMSLSFLQNADKITTLLKPLVPLAEKRTALVAAHHASHDAYRAQLQALDEEIAKTYGKLAN